MDARVGDVVWCDLPDESGGNNKTRPAVVIAVGESGEVCVLVAGTTSFVESDLGENLIQLPYTKDRRTKSCTGLVKKTAVKCSWTTVVNVDKIDKKSGYVPKKLLEPILIQVRKLKQSEKPDSGATDNS